MMAPQADDVLPGVERLVGYLRVLQRDLALSIRSATFEGDLHYPVIPRVI
jgi:hypothetical protein